MFKFIKIKNQIIIIIFTLLGLILRSIYNFDLIYWGDETFTLYISDPKISLKEFISRHKEIDDNPIIYFFIIRLFNFFTYSAEIIRLSSILFGILTIPLSYIFFKNFFKDNALIFEKISNINKIILSCIIFYFLFILPCFLIEPIRYTKYFIFFNLLLNICLLVITYNLIIKKIHFNMKK